ncbi:MAG: SsrA-binding protein SmpB [Patescibacteria group bacterium]
MALLENKKARLEYEILETYEAGIELYGHEVKSVRGGKGSLIGAHIVIRGNEAYLVGATVSPYQQGNVPKSYDPERTRRLLLSRKELRELEGADSRKGLTLIPLMVYNKNRFLKLSFGLARKKKAHDKRAALKDRDAARDMDRTLKGE